MVAATFILQSVVALAGICVAAPNAGRLFPRVAVQQEHLEILRMRSAMSINSAAVSDVSCLDANK
jgi:hypothetical protein